MDNSGCQGWDSHAVGTWLQGLDLKHSYVKAFRSADVDGQTLTSMSMCLLDSNLRVEEHFLKTFVSETVPSFGDRMKLLEALRNLGGG
jgi:hypothetical protein